MSLAAIDIGSNTLHMIIVKPRASGRFDRLTAQSEFMGLGPVAAGKGHFPSSTVSALRRTLENHLKAARQWGADPVLIAATAAMRRASNGREVVNILSRKLGVPVRLISSEREGFLGFLGVRPLLRDHEEQLLIDGGGGSTELSLTHGQRRVAGVALPMGTGTLSAQMEQDPPDPLAWARLKRPILDALALVPKSWKPRRAIAYGGSARQFRKLLNAPPRASISLQGLGKAVRLLLSRPAKKLSKKVGIKPLRLRVLPTGALILATILEHFELERFETTRLGLRDGMVRAYLEQGDHWWED